MGCDIHVYTECKNSNGDWENVDNWRYSYYSEGKELYVNSIFYDRDYTLFSFLAGVRNYDEVESFGFNRGLPDDCSEVVRKEAEAWGEDGHTHGWCTLSELLRAIEGVETVEHHGIVTKEDAAEYRETGKTPEIWCRGVGTLMGIDPEYEDRYEWINWNSKPDCFDKLVAAMQERKREVFWIRGEDDGHYDDNFRIVFWFDN